MGTATRQSRVPAFPSLPIVSAAPKLLLVLIFHETLVNRTRLLNRVGLCLFLHLRRKPMELAVTRPSSVAAPHTLCIHAMSCWTLCRWNARCASPGMQTHG